MNAFENWFCSSGIWRYITRAQILPWVLSDADLGERVLEIGAGAGAATAQLRQRAPRVFSLEYDRSLAARIARRSRGEWIIVQGDAAQLPFADNSFSSVVAILMLHHLRSGKMQDETFAEARRILRPGGHFLAMDISDGWWHRILHRNSTFVPLDPRILPERLRGAGFAQVDVREQGSQFRVLAARA